MAFYRYIADTDVHVIDCSGTVDIQLGLERLQILERELAVRPVLSGRRKLLVDFRHMVWASDDAHRQLSMLTRHAFGIDARDQVRAAFIHSERTGIVAPNEAWFANEPDAMKWLLGA